MQRGDRGGAGLLPGLDLDVGDAAADLLDQGADMNARDLDHESTPAQYMVRSRPEIARYLVRRGAKSDILMAAALGDIDLVEKLLQDDPECVRMRVDNEHFPKANFHSGGTIYQWELGWHVSACQVAKSFGHAEVFNLLNTVNLNAPAATQGAANFGTITSALDPRVLQFAAKFWF